MDDLSSLKRSNWTMGKKLVIINMTKHNDVDITTLFIENTIHFVVGQIESYSFIERVNGFDLIYSCYHNIAKYDSLLIIWSDKEIEIQEMEEIIT